MQRPEKKKIHIFVKITEPDIVLVQKAAFQ